MNLLDGFKWWSPAWLAVNVFTLYGSKKGRAKAPDYTPVAQASTEAAKIGAELGREQLAENRRQYDQNVAEAAPIIRAQAGLMQQQIQQGNDYYDYNQRYGRPVEMSLYNDAMGLTADQKAQEQQERDGITGLNNNLAERIGETDAQVYNRHRDDIEAESGQAVADARAGFTNAINTAARQGLRYGFSPEKLAAMAGSESVQQAAQQAAAANTTRKTATQTMYGRGVGAAQQQLTGGMQARSMKQQDEALRYAKKLDTAGLYRGLPGVSQGAYGLAVNAGNSAVGNQMAPSNAFMNGINQGNSTIMQGQNMKINGLSSVLQAQGSAYSAGQKDSSGIWGALGHVGGAYVGAKFSDEKVKKNVTDHDDDKSLEGIKKLDVKEWEYDPDKVEGQDDRRHTGAMAQDMQKNLGENVSDGRMVDLISAVGTNMAATKALAKKVDKLEKRK